VIRHKLTIRDLGLVLCGTLVAFYVTYALDIFENEGSITVKTATIELDETLLIGAAVAVALLGLGIRYYVAQKREIARRLAAERRIRELAYQDALTGLPNRRQFDEALNAAILSPPHSGAAHAVFLIDLNGFKQVNDVHGHGVGDELLIIVGQRILAAVRDGDLVARFGGDEFAILARHIIGSEAATNIALRITEALDAPIETGAGIHRVGAGIGIALVPGDAASVDEALRKADVALYRAKGERRSALRFFEPQMDARVMERASLQRALREAIDQDQIGVAFQPTVDLGTGAIIGFEAIPFWSDAEQGEILPQRFIPIAEEAGLVYVLAERVLRKGCEAATRWPRNVALSVDVYPSQLKDDLLPTRILRILKEGGLAPDRLEIEVPESAIVADMESAQKTLGSLREAGVRIALDNFGTGYSSLYHLCNFGLDKIKIDRRFTDLMENDRASRSIVNALAGLARGLGLTIAAEGIEAPGQQNSLRGSGCEQGQGRLYSEPLTTELTAKLFSNERQKVG
jgi:diguanylate cyclase (GGDEF)-like protein